MSQIQSGSEATAAALVGSLATFSLFDVLDLLAGTGHTGELQVVGRAIDQRVWVDRGDLLDPTGHGSDASAFFELACVEEGWFYFTLVGSVPEGHARVPIGTVLTDLGPQVEEWRTLVASLPFDARVSMSSSTPGPAVQIRSDQWQLLSLVGNPGRTVRAVVDAADTHPLDTLRTLRELIDAHLVSLVLASPGLPSHGPVGSHYASPDPYTGEPGSGSPEGTVHAPSAATGPVPGAAEHADAGSEPAPVRSWSASEPASAEPRAEPETWRSETDQQPPARTGSVPEGGGDHPATPPASRAPARTGSTPAPIPPAPEGFVERDESVEGPITRPAAAGDPDADTAAVPAVPAAVTTTTRTARRSAMPPPISGDPWSSSPPAGDRGSEEDR